MSYKNTAFELTKRWYSALAGKIHTKLNHQMKNVLWRINWHDDYDYTNEVKNFYSSFGLNIAGKNISENITQSELDNVIESIKNMVKTYE